MSAVPRRGLRPDGTQVCVRALGDEIDCGAPAMWHIWWKHDEITSSSCNKHYEEAVARGWEMLDSHPFGGVCLIPGVMWQFCANEESGFCFLPIDLDEPIEVVEPISAFVASTSEATS